MNESGWTYLGPCLKPAEADALRAENARLREAANKYIQAMEGFAKAVREDTGLAYPWPEQKITRAKLRAALEVKP